MSARKVAIVRSALSTLNLAQRDPMATRLVYMPLQTVLTVQRVNIVTALD